MALDEKSMVGAHVVSSVPSTTTTTPERPRLNLKGISSNNKSSYDLTASQYPTPTEEYDPSSTHPFSAFYSHPTTRTSFEQHKSESKTNIRVYEQDLESGRRVPASFDTSRKSSHKECTVWPGRHQVLQKHQALQKRRGCRLWNDLSKRQKLSFQILFALIVVGAAIGIGIGVSKAVGAGVWKSANSETQIGK